MDEKFCDERRASIIDKVNTHEIRINNHSGRIDMLEQSQSGFKIEIKNLCKDIQNLTSTLKWFIGLIVGSFVAFFFYAVQNKIL